MDRKLSLQRVLALEVGPVARYLSPLLTQSGQALTRDSYLKTIVTSLSDDRARTNAVRLAAADLRSALVVGGAVAAGPDMEATVARRAAVLREVLNRHGGIPEQEMPEPSATTAAPSGAALPVVIWIPHLRSPFNVGNIIRTAAGFGVTGVILGETVPHLSHPRLQRAAMGATEMISIVRGGRREAAELLGVARPTVVALETGGTEINRFAFPHSGVMLVGHEELGVPAEMLQECYRNDHVVSIPHGGPKTSLNVGVAAGICLSWWQIHSSTD